MIRLHTFLFACFLAVLLSAQPALARDVTYNGDEESIWVTPGEPTQVTFPSVIEGGYKAGDEVTVQRQGNFVVLFAKAGLSPDGEVMIVRLRDGRSYSLRISPAGFGQARDASVTIIDRRQPESEQEDESIEERELPFAPPTVATGLMREIVLITEFGRKKGISGYKRSNTYTGEEVLNDGTIRAKIDEIFMGPRMWGYVLDIENLLGTGQRLNPGTFNFEGVMAVSMKRWELAPKPRTAEQKLSGRHKTKIYVITKPASREFRSLAY